MVTGSVALHTGEPQTTLKLNWLMLGAMTIVAGAIAGLLEKSLFSSTTADTREESSANFFTNPPTTHVETSEETSSNSLLRFTCTGFTVHEQASCTALSDHLRNTDSSDSMKNAFLALSATRGITRENRMVLSREFAFFDRGTGFCEVPLIAPEELRQPVMWGLDLTPQTCPFMAIGYEAKDPSNNETEQCVVVLSQASMDPNRPLFSSARPNCPQGALNPENTMPMSYHNTLVKFFQGNPLEARSLDGRTVILKLKE